MRGEEVKRVRMKLGMTQDQFANLLGMSGKQAICTQIGG